MGDFNHPLPSSHLFHFPLLHLNCIWPKCYQFAGMSETLAGSLQIAGT
jgi:hypothetical protein